MIFRDMKPHEIDGIWLECREILKAAFRQRIHVHTVDDYYPMLKVGDATLWCAIEDDKIIGCVVTVVDIGTGAKVVTMLSLAGRGLKKWIGLLDKTLTEYAERLDCDAVEAVTRRGFSRFVPDFVEDGVVYIKVIRGKS